MEILIDKPIHKLHERSYTNEATRMCLAQLKCGLISGIRYVIYAARVNCDQPYHRKRLFVAQLTKSFAHAIPYRNSPLSIPRYVNGKDVNKGKRRNTTITLRKQHYSLFLNPPLLCTIVISRLSIYKRYRTHRERCSVSSLEIF